MKINGRPRINQTINNEVINNKLPLLCLSNTTPEDRLINRVEIENKIILKRIDKLSECLTFLKYKLEVNELFIKKIKNET